jgi:TonB family protein
MRSENVVVVRHISAALLPNYRKQKMRQIKIFMLTLMVGSFACQQPYLKRYPEQFPPEIVSKTSNLDLIITNYENDKADSLKTKNAKKSSGKRSRKSIMKTVMSNIQKLRFAYNKRLRERPGLWGKITVKYSISEKGNVVSSSILSSSIDDSGLENTVKDKILRWQFDTLDVVDTTEVVYPFVFTQGQTGQDLKRLDFEKEKRGDRAVDEILTGWTNCSSRLKTLFDDYSNHSGQDYGSFDVLVSITRSGFIDNIVLKNTTIESKDIEIKLLQTIRAITFPNCTSCKGNTDVEFAFGFYNKN